VYLRPGVREFMAAAVERFAAVGVWTSATPDYAVAMLDRVVDRHQLRFITRSLRAERDLGAAKIYWVKDIRKLVASYRRWADPDRRRQATPGSSAAAATSSAFVVHGRPRRSQLGKLLRFSTSSARRERAAGSRRGWWLRFDDEFDVQFGGERRSWRGPIFLLMSHREHLRRRERTPSTARRVSMWLASLLAAALLLALVVRFGRIDLWPDPLVLPQL
jgi:hypothetical protein